MKNQMVICTPFQIYIDFSLYDLCIFPSDIGAVIAKMYPDDDGQPIILVGHSMGGAIAIHTAVKFLVPSLLGLVVIDVVEGNLSFRFNDGFRA